MKNLKQKMKSYSFWTALSGAVVILIGSISKALGLSLDSEIAEEIIMGVCGILVAVGLVNAKTENSTDNKKTDTSDDNIDSDDKQELDEINDNDKTDVELHEDESHDITNE